VSDDSKLVILNPQSRLNALRYVNEAPNGWRVRVEPPKRGKDINAALHALLTEISRTHWWAGRQWPMEVWKRLMVAAWSRAHKDPVMMVPALDGHGVDIVMLRTSALSQADVRDLMTYIECWAAENQPPEVVDAEPVRRKLPMAERVGVPA
jgi:hypothetical protein